MSHLDRKGRVSLIVEGKPACLLSAADARTLAAAFVSAAEALEGKGDA